MQALYSELFDWQFTKTKDRSMDEAYHVAYQENTPVAAVFTMPSYLQKINMPSFWMSYVQVEDIEETVTKSIQLKKKLTCFYIQMGRA